VTLLPPTLPHSAQQTLVDAVTVAVHDGGGGCPAPLSVASHPLLLP
jgi:hypothetical protein